jgi:tetratricopeptide (TPR) repeat protein
VAALSAASDSESIGRRVRRLRLERGLSQHELSEPGVCYAFISRIEAENRRPSVKALRILARKLGVSPEYLESGSDLRDADRRELELAEAELVLRLGNDQPAAQAVFSMILVEAQAAGDAHSAVRARLGLGLAAALAENDAETVEQLEAALAGEPLAAAARPDVYLTLGRAYSNLGQPQRAVRLFERCLAEVGEQTPGELGLQVRYASYLSYALTDAGMYERAQQLLLDLADRSEHDPDPYTRVRLYWSLGRLATREGHALSGLGYFRCAVALLETTEDTLHLARAHLSCAWALTKSGRAEQAGRHLELAENLFGEPIDKADLGWLRTEQAKRAAELDQGTNAIAYAREALDALGTSDPAEQGDAWLALAQGQHLCTDLKAAGEAFQHALDLLIAHRPAADCARAYRLWAALLEQTGRKSDAAKALEQANAISAREEREPLRHTAPLTAQPKPGSPQDE